MGCRGSNAKERNTPTCVGRTAARPGWPRDNQKHPHVRGEDSPRVSAEATRLETPPRAWGGLLDSSIVSPEAGNTPTCVGRTGQTPGTAREMKKHPHVRGEDAACRGSRDWIAETPPRAWGGPNRGQRFDAQQGNTPTCVGRTPHSTAGKKSGQKHPHVRGEDSTCPMTTPGVSETPPRAWGGHQHLVCRR